MRRHVTMVGGVPVAWEEAGGGPPVVFVHGIPTGPALWRRVVPLVGGARCLVLEMVGYADSIPAGRGRDISVDRQADHLLGWLERIEAGPAVLVGHDLGGGVVQIAATRRPAACAGLVLTNSIAYDSWPIPSVRAMRAAGPLLGRLPPAALRPLMAPLFLRGHDDLGRARAALAVHWRPYAAHGAGPALVRQARSLHTRDTEAVAGRLRGLGVPARIVWGTADRFQKIAYGERLARDLDAPLVRIEGGRHFTPEDHPAEIAAAVTALLAGTPDARVARPPS